MMGMKGRLLLLLPALFVSVLLQAQVPPVQIPKDGPRLKLVGYKWNVGKFSKAKTPLRGAVYPFTNVGNAPLVIEKVNPHCGCLRVDWIRTPVPPGGKGWVKVIYDGREQLPRYFQKTAVIYTNNPEPYRYFTLYLEGEMTE